MTDINLLPWRELKREREKKQFTVYLFAALLFGVVIVFFINSYGQGLVNEQTQRNQLLQTEITLLQKQIKEILEIKSLRQALVARMTIVQNLLVTRGLTVRLFDQMVKVMPDGLFLTKVERVINKISIFGYAQSNSDISVLMRFIENNVWIKSPELTEIKKTKDILIPGAGNEFKLSFILGSQGDELLEDESPDLNNNTVKPPLNQSDNKPQNESK